MTVLSQKIQTKLIRLSNELFHIPPGRYRHFTFILYRNRIASIGWNNYLKTGGAIAGKFHESRDCKIHSELSALKNFKYPVNRLKDFTIVNTRISVERKISMSAPCTNCRKMLQFFGVEELWYTDNQGNFNECHLQ